MKLQLSEFFQVDEPRGLSKLALFNFFFVRFVKSVCVEIFSISQSKYVIDFYYSLVSPSLGFLRWMDGWMDGLIDR